MNHYPRHVGDFIGATIGLSLMERGAYSALLDRYYMDEAPLPLDRREVYRMAACASAAERKAVDYVLSRYFTEEADGWHQKRADAEIAKYAERSESAKRSIDARWGKRNTNVSETKAERTTNQEPVTKNQEPEEKKSTRVPREVASLPPWLPPEDWARWAQHRGKKLTAAAVPLQIRKLDGLRAEGHDPVALIDLAIESGWATFWPPKDAPRGRHASLTAVGSRTAENLRRFADDEEMPNGTHGP